MEDKKYEKYVSKVKDATQDFLQSHKPTGAELGPFYILLGEDVMPDSDMRVAVRHVLKGRVIAEYPDYVDRHTHDVSKGYIFLSEEPDSLEADVTLGKEKYSVKSPAAVYVPPGLEHDMKITKGHGFLIIIMPMKGTYNEHTFPVAADKP
ncbi:MAG: hypothetical protein QME90_06220 [Thermodesulfobacteriota bacterium]|nr:hypothetical protein [Thermodesulfobacteriota bacterium]